MNAAETGSETRWTSRWAGPIVWAVALSAQPSVALGQLQPELEARSHAGFDSNPGLAAVPGGRRDPSLEPELGPSGIAGLQGFVGAQYGGDLWIRGRLSLDGAWLTAGATRLEGRLGLEVGAEVDPFAISLGLLVGRYAASFGEDDAS
ncbi:MAG: hypothetical protein OEY14_04330, partial [Myxococcales bacterium]|nr:hypothetical protein [Myxococcales bacterium]